eukprot:s3996_g4.t1
MVRTRNASRAQVAGLQATSLVAWDVGRHFAKEVAAGRISAKVAQEEMCIEALARNVDLDCLSDTWKGFSQGLLRCLEEPVPDAMLIADALDGRDTAKGFIEETYAVFAVGPKQGALGIILCSESGYTSLTETDSELEDAQDAQAGQKSTRGRSFKVTVVAADEKCVQRAWQCKSNLFSRFWPTVLSYCLEHGKGLFRVDIPFNGPATMDIWNRKAAEAFMKHCGCKCAFMSLLGSVLKQVATNASCLPELVQTTKQCVSASEGALFSFKNYLSGKMEKVVKAKPSVTAKVSATRAKPRRKKQTLKR